MAPKKKKKPKAEDGEGEEIDIENNAAVLHYELSETRKSLEQFRDNYVTPNIAPNVLCACTIVEVRGVMWLLVAGEAAA